MVEAIFDFFGTVILIIFVLSVIGGLLGVLWAVCQSAIEREREEERERQRREEAKETEEKIEKWKKHPLFAEMVEASIEYSKTVLKWEMEHPSAKERTYWIRWDWHLNALVADGQVLFQLDTEKTYKSLDSLQRRTLIMALYPALENYFRKIKWVTLHYYDDEDDDKLFVPAHIRVVIIPKLQLNDIV